MLVKCRDGIFVKSPASLASRYTIVEWGLYSSRLHRLQVPPDEKTKKETLEHEKGTLVESIFGVVISIKV